MRALTAIILVALINACNKGENNGNGVAGEYPEVLKIDVKNSSDQNRVRR